MKNILVPIDFSSVSQDALKYAVKMALPLDANITIIHLEKIPVDLITEHSIEDFSKKKSSNESLIQLLRINTNKLKQLEKEYSTDKILVTSQQHGRGFLKGMKSYISKNKIDLIIIGTSGKESIQEFFTGNHTEQLIENLNIPVLSIQEKQIYDDKDIVLGLDLIQEKYTRKAFSMIKIITDALGARLHIINVIKSDLPENLLIRLNIIAKKVKLSNYIVDFIQDTKECDALMHYAEEVDADLIITLSEAKSGLYRFFQHSFATKLTKSSPIPVLTINKNHL